MPSQCWDMPTCIFIVLLSLFAFPKSSLPTLFAAEGEFSFLSASPKHILPEFLGGWQSTKKESRAGGLWASELKCFHVAPLVNHDCVCGSSMTEQRGSMLQIFEVA